MAVVAAPIPHGGGVVVPTTEVTRSYRGLWSWITTVDHKRIGIMYGVAAGTFFLIGGLEALVVRLQLWVPNNTLVSASTFNAMFTMHATTMIFLAVMPLSVAFFNFIVPLQIGARDVAFPRLNAFSFWVFISGGILLNLSFVLGGAPDAGWFGYANLTSKQFSPGPGIDFWILGLQVLGISSVAGALNFLVTIINMRAPGMTYMRMPIFTWMSLITMILLVLAFPAITIGLVLLMFDRHFGTNFFEVAKGGDVILWQNLFWVFGHPEVYILILPAMGIVSEILPVFSRKPLFGYAVMVFSGMAIAFLAFGVWAHHMFAVGLGPLTDAIFSATTMLIAIPTGVKIFNWISTMWGGSIRYTTAMLYAVGFIAMFIIGGLSGVMHSSPPADLQQSDTYFVVAHIHYVLIGGSITALLGGIYYWFPKFSGRYLNETLGKWNFWTFFITINMTFMPMHWTGLLGMPRRVYTYAPELGVTTLNQISTVGAIGLAFSILLFVVNVFVSLRYSPKAVADPWDGATLEWSISSPPPIYNFAQVPVVHSRDAFWAMKYPDRTEHGDLPDGDGTGSPHAHLAPTGHTGQPAADLVEAKPTLIHMPAPSYFPFIVAMGLVIAGSGIVFTFALTPVGILIMMAGIFGWAFEPA
ncbi:MAG: cytochrome c oxidase subunit I [Chloroflexi bacterium]|nr:cytochrome c oxidase subunit I [Chloroflexota bacterium]